MNLFYVTIEQYELLQAIGTDKFGHLTDVIIKLNALEVGLEGDRHVFGFRSEEDRDHALMALKHYGFVTVEVEDHAHS